ncbi:MAG: four helix bundle protein [Bacteroidales bacterium]|nr:four helix bundle protein [Bacteroidales bacterium]
MDKYSLEDRLIDYAVLSLEIAKLLPNTFEGRHLSSQLIRSGTSPALNYGEAQGAESKKDFLHKIRVILKELRESLICMKIIKRRNLIDDVFILEKGIAESNELISIFVKTAKTAQQNILKEPYV